MAKGVWRPLSGPSHQVALEILLDGPLSRAELSRRVGLSPGSLTRLTKPMVESGLLVEVSAGADRSAGRTAVPATRHRPRFASLRGHQTHLGRGRRRTDQPARRNHRLRRAPTDRPRSAPRRRPRRRPGVESCRRTTDAGRAQRDRRDAGWTHRRADRRPLGTLPRLDRRPPRATPRDAYRRTGGRRQRRPRPDRGDALVRRRTRRDQVLPADDRRRDRVRTRHPRPGRRQRGRRPRADRPHPTAPGRPTLRPRPPRLRHDTAHLRQPSQDRSVLRWAGRSTTRNAWTSQRRATRSLQRSSVLRGRRSAASSP